MKGKLTLRTVLGCIVAMVGISAVAFPSLGWAFLSARQLTSISNMQKCGRALLLYQSQWNEFPNARLVGSLLSKESTFDPNDKWRSSPNMELGRPMVGSYAYLGSVKYYEDRSKLAELLARRPNATLLASIFYASQVPKHFEGDVSLPPWHFPDSVLPDRVLRFCADGSFKVTYDQTYYPIENGVRYKLFHWVNLFDQDREAQSLDETKVNP